MFAEAKVTSKGQITLPKVIRDYLGGQPGDHVGFVVREGRVEVEIVGGSILDWYGAEPVTETQQLNTVRDQVRRAISDEVVREGH